MKEIPLSQGKCALVDDAWYEYLSQWTWHCDGKGYAMRKEGVESRRKSILMHRVIAQAPADMDVDHINGNKLDNQSYNLRLCTHAENCRNQKKRIGSTSAYKGVSRFGQSQKWQAAIRANSKTIHLGLFANEIDAAKAYDKAARIHYGEFARLNFPD